MIFVGFSSHFVFEKWKFGYEQSFCNMLPVCDFFFGFFKPFIVVQYLRSACEHTEKVPSPSQSTPKGYHGKGQGKGQMSFAMSLNFSKPFKNQLGIRIPDVKPFAMTSERDRCESNSLS
jgi:hypothetical protein